MNELDKMLWNLEGTASYYSVCYSVLATGIGGDYSELTLIVWASCWSWSVGGDAKEWRAGMQRLSLQGGSSEPQECVEGLWQAPQQDIIQVPCT